MRKMKEPEHIIRIPPGEHKNNPELVQLLGKKGTHFFDKLNCGICVCVIINMIMGFILILQNQLYVTEYQKSNRMLLFPANHPRHKKKSVVFVHH